jgi:hypothetical protein
MYEEERSVTDAGPVWTDDETEAQEGSLFLDDTQPVIFF